MRPAERPREGNPASWTQLNGCDELAPGALRTVKVRGQEAILFRDDAGKLRMIGAHCPHLGAHLGQGRVVGGAVQCPFHHWRIDGSGCVESVPYSPRKTPKARIQCWEVREEPGGVAVRTVHIDGPSKAVLPPFPDGWYALAFDTELARGPIEGSWCGRRLRLTRDRDGTARIEVLDGGAPVELVQMQDAVFGWFDSEQTAPSFSLPRRDRAGFSRFRGHCFEGLRSHPQETSENSVDIAHFSSVHGYTDVIELEEATADGPVLRARYGFTHRGIAIGLRGLRTEFDVELHGLGYSFVETAVPAYGMRTRQLVLATPIGDGRIQLRISGAVRLDGVPAFLRRPTHSLIRSALMRAYVSDVSDDLDIWEAKAYLDRPRIVAGDGPLGRYRRWARQFYTRAAQQAPGV